MKNKKKPNEQNGIKEQDFKYLDEENANGITFYEDRTDAIKHKPIYYALIGVLYGVILLLVVGLILKIFFSSATVEGESMDPVLQDGDVVITSHYIFSSPKRYDIVVVTIDRAEGLNYVKRVIGLPGETIQIKDGKVYINGELLEDDKFGSTPILEGGIASEPITLGEKEYFVLGDNRSVSQDSRKLEIGVIAKGQIRGKVVFRIGPFKRFGRIK
ncbi:MAG: signal peptidase I [Lachnospiraceae bacterium]|nr:signal peptidase I [Lachnospiraceae bacterium]